MIAPSWWRATVIPCWMIVGDWRAHPARILIAISAIAVGVALGFAVHVVNASALERFAHGLATVNGGADLRIQAAGPEGFDERLYPRISRLPGIAAVSPAITLGSRLDGHAIDLLGLDALRVYAATPILMPRPEQRAGAIALFSPQSLFLSREALAGRAIGDVVRLAVNGRTQQFRIAGTLPGVRSGMLAVIDIAAAQDLVGRPGRIDRIDLKLADDADPTKVRAAIAAILPANAVIAGPDDDADRTDALSRAYRVNLDMLSLVALLTGAFLVYSAQSLSIARRRPQFAFLRVLGASGRMILAQLLAEGLILGTIGSAIGIVGGLALAAGVLHFVGGDLGSGQFSGIAPPALKFPPGAALFFASLGTTAALLGSFLPARDPARSTPTVALKNVGDAIDPRHRPQLAPALFLAIIGLGFALLPPVNGIALFAYGAMGLILAAGIAAMPWFARALLTPIARRSITSPTATLALSRLWGAPSQATVALSGIVASVGLMIAMAIMVASFRSSVDEWLDQILSADLYLDAVGGTSFAPATQARLAAVPGVARVRFGSHFPIVLSPDRPPVTLVVRDSRANVLPTIGAVVAAPPRMLTVQISEPAARLYRWSPGSIIMLPLGVHAVRAIVTAEYRDYARQDGAIVIDSTHYTAITGDSGRDEAAVDLDPGADIGATADALHKALPVAISEGVEMIPTRALKARALAVFDRSFAITYGLEFVAILVGLAGVVTTSSAQTFARSREFGMLRHLGVTPRQILTILGFEGALLGLIGAAAGVMLGLCLAQILIQVVNPQSFNWTMETHVPAKTLCGVALTLIVSSALTAIMAGRRAVSIDAVRAVREDW